MSVYFETSLGDVVFDLYTKRCPVACKNFIQLCKSGFYNGCLFYNLEKSFIVQSGDRTGTGQVSDSFDGGLFPRELPTNVKHDKVGILGYSHKLNNNFDVTNNAKVNGSQFYITLRRQIDYLDGKYTAFGSLEEDPNNIIQQLNNMPTDNDGRPLADIRILKAHVIDDPFAIPSNNVVVDKTTFILDNNNNGDYRPKEEIVVPRVSWKKLNNTADKNNNDKKNHHGNTSTHVETSNGTNSNTKINIKEKQNADSAAKTLEILGDLPTVDTKPPETVLFVCKLNSITDSDALELIFSRFGDIKSCHVVCDWKTGDSLQYAFIEYENEESCNEAYLKMNNVKIDDRRIQVDFSQSVSKEWNAFKRRGGGSNRSNGKNVSKGGGMKRRWVEKDSNDNNDNNNNNTTAGTMTKKRRWVENDN